MTYTFESEYPRDLLTYLGQEDPYAHVVTHPVWGGNINGYPDGGGTHFGRMIEVRALVLHTPEEAADHDEVTPRYFSTWGVRRSTHDYIDNDGDLYGMVAHKDAAWGQGTSKSNRTWKGAAGLYAPWCPPGHSNNQYSLGVEIEGFAGTINKTLSRAQYATIARWIAYNATRYSIPLDRDHIVGHYELSTDKTDPGGLPIQLLIDSAKMLITRGIAMHENGLFPGVTNEPTIPTFDLPEALRAAYRTGRDNTLRLVRSRLTQELSRVDADMLGTQTDAILDEALEELLP